MGLFNDVVTSLMTDAGKSSTTDRTHCEKAVRRTINAVNRALDSAVIASRSSSIAVAANAQEVTMPTAARKIKELGYYDSATDRIAYPFTEITERDFHENFSGSMSLTAISPTDRNLWFFIDNTSGGASQIRLVYPPSSAFTMMATYFEKLTETNVDLLDDDDLIYNGSVPRLAAWFPKLGGSYFQLYSRGLDEMKSAHRSTKRTVSEKQHPAIAIQNMVGGYLVD